VRTIEAAPDSTNAPGRDARSGAVSLRHRVSNAIRAAVVTGEMAAGQIYSVPALANEFAVSLTPVREAMLDLVNEGLAEPVRNRGFRIVEASEADLDEIFDLRLLLEVPSMVKLAGTLTAADGKRFREVADVIEAAAAEGDLVAFLAADREFHLGLLGLLGNERLVRFVDMLRLQSRLPGLEELARQSALPASAEEHQHILNALIEGDRSGVKRLMIRHLRHTRGIWAGMKE
jgi:DNA-binding GntR family transcriptional regulator